MQIEELLKALAVDGVSDIHFKVARPPLTRKNGELEASALPPLSPKETENLAMSILGERGWEKFRDASEMDTSFAVPGLARFRVSVFRQRGSVSLVLRIIPFSVPSLEELGVPDVVKSIALEERGLILVTGVTGSGKSSTLAGMIKHVNQSLRCHVITIEDPIEFLHKDDQASINQREISIDTKTFADAFRAALRQDPDIILVGELRDRETMEIALKAAETGHLVMSTVHTTDAKETVSRFIDAFPTHQQNQIRINLSANLKAVISQRLLHRADGKGRILAAEIMIVNAAIRGHILNPADLDEIPRHMAKGKSGSGMQTFDQALLEMVQKKLISEEEALKHATSPNDLKLKLTLS